jgi:hypothetical protein
LAKEFEICAYCGCVVANTEMHLSYHAYLQATIGRMNDMLNIIWDDSHLDKNKKLDPLPPPPTLDY